MEGLEVSMRDCSDETKKEYLKTCLSRRTIFYNLILSAPAQNMREVIAILAELEFPSRGGHGLGRGVLFADMDNKTAATSCEIDGNLRLPLDRLQFWHQVLVKTPEQIQSMTWGEWAKIILDRDLYHGPTATCNGALELVAATDLLLPRTGRTWVKPEEIPIIKTRNTNPRYCEECNGVLDDNSTDELKFCSIKCQEKAIQSESHRRKRAKLSETSNDPLQGIPADGPTN